MTNHKQAIKDILDRGEEGEIRALFGFTVSDTDERVMYKYRLWSRWFFPKFFKSKDAPFHQLMDSNNLKVYRGVARSYTNAGFRGCSKTTNTKLFVAYCIANDLDHSRRYFKVLSGDIGNSKQIVTDIYNLLIDPKIVLYYPEIFEKTVQKREETMGSFTTATGVKILADTVGSDQRGQIQEDSRPDFIWFDDFETRNTLRSAVKTKVIWDNMQEGIEGLAKGGGYVATCNYLSERGNVHKLIDGGDERNIVQIVPIKDKDGNPTWSARYSKEEVDQILKDADDPEGEYLQNPALSRDTFFDRDSIDKMDKHPVQREIAGHRLYFEYVAGHRYAMGADVAGGVGLDSSTTVIWDFDTVPARVVATYKSNTISPEQFGYEMSRQGDRFGQCLIAPENNNHGHASIAILKQAYPIDKIHQTQRPDTRIEVADRTEYGWNTNSITKPKMLSKLARDIEDGLVDLVDPDLIREARSYTRNDLMDREIDPRLSTRHYDLLIAACIGYQMKDFVSYDAKDDPDALDYIPDEPIYRGIGI